MERNLHYTTALASGLSDNPLVANISRDLSATNRKKFHDTADNGVPLVYDLTVQVAIEDPGTSITVQPMVVPSTYAFKNGSKKLQQALKKKARAAGLDLHAWNKTVNYSFSRDMSHWTVMTPSNGHPDNATPYNYVGGEWEYSKFSIDQADGSRDQFIVHLLGEHTPASYLENTDPTGTNLISMSLSEMWLSTLGQVTQPDDDALDQAEFPILEQLLRPFSDVDDFHYAKTEIADTNDDAPYAQNVPGGIDQPDVSHGILKGQLVLSTSQGMVQTTRLLAPYGWLGLRTKRTVGTGNADIYVQCNGISKLGA